jgi:hypothetical protein
MRRSVAVLAVAILLTSMASCSSGDDDPTLTGDVPTTRRTTTTTEPAPTTTQGPACPPVETAHGEDGLVERRADVDGDGRDDLVQSFRAPEGAAQVTLVVELAAGGGAALDLESARDAPTELLGTAVVERLDGRHLLWVRVGAGASTVVLGLYWLDRCDLRPVVLPNGDPVEVPVGGSVRSVSGARCGSLLDPQADLIVYEGRSDDGRQYELTVSEHRYDDGVLTPSPEADPSTETTNDPSEASRFRCGDVVV